MMTKKLFSRVQITTNSRLHFGFLNINSRENYSFGGMGLSIDKYPTITTISKAREFKSNLSRALNKKIEGFIKCNKVNKNIEIKCVESPPSHIGLGSGTQLILSLEEALIKFYRLNHTKTNIFNRTYRSGVGYNSYRYGGFIVDSPKKNLSTNEAIFKYKFPKDWKIILLFDNKIRGTHGDKENKFFLDDSKSSLRKKLSDLTLNEIIPSVIYKDFDIFAKSLTQFQKINSSFYTSIQKSSYLSKHIGGIIKRVSSTFNVAVGQSSWGPTSYMFTNSRNDLKEIISILDKEISMYNNLSYDIVSAKNNSRKLSFS